MFSKKLLDLLTTFSKRDLNRFRRYINSPFFNENDDLSNLFDIVDEYLRQGGNSKQKQLSKKDVWKRLFGKERYKDGQLRRLSSELTRHAFHFLSLQVFEEDTIATQLYLLPQLTDRKLHKHFQGIVRQAEREQERSERRDAAFHHHQYDLDKLNHIHIERGGEKVGELQHLEAADYHLDAYYLTQKLRHYCDTLYYQKDALFYNKKSSSKSTQIELPPGFLEYVAGSRYMEEPSVKAYYLVSQMLLHPDKETYFHQLKSFLKEHVATFGRSEQYNLYIFLNNYCTDTKINVGRQDYIEELFDLFRSMLDNELILDNGILNPQYYKNIITVGLHLKKFDWVEQFIQEYTGKLPEENQENALNYNLAKVYFHKKDYEKVIEQLREVEYRDLIYALGGKQILLKTYYELGEFLVLDSLIESFRIYLQRNRKISKEVRQQYLNVLRFVKQLSKIMPGDKKALQKIRKQIEECKELADRKWIQEKVQEVENSGA